MEMNDLEEEIDSKYLIKKKLCSSGTAKAYIVIEKETNEEYVAKILKKELKGFYYNEINILKELKKYNNPYIINIIDSGEGYVKFKNKEPEKREYLILEYALYGDLEDFIISYLKNEGTALGELYTKIIFKKILEGVKFCHEHNICHRDLKLKNILLDKNFTPKICDFGFACENSPNLKDKLGTPAFLPPEIVSKNIINYDGFKADIFCLGEILILLTTGKPGFQEQNYNDKLFYNLMLNHTNLYWKIFCGQIPGVILSEEFKELYVKMLKYMPNQRPNIDEVLQHRWFKEINEMDKEQLEILEKKLREKFLEVADKIIKDSEKIYEVKKTNSDESSSYRSGDEDNFFEPYIKPKILHTPMIMKNCIKIIGSLNPANFMNSFCDLLKEEFENEDCMIEPHKQKLQFNVTLNEEVEEEKEEITEEVREELKKLGIEEIDNNDESYNELIIQVKLYKILDGYLLRFIQKKGLRQNFLGKFEAISDLVKKLIC